MRRRYSFSPAQACARRTYIGKHITICTHHTLPRKYATYHFSSGWALHIPCIREFMARMLYANAALIQGTLSSILPRTVNIFSTFTYLSSDANIDVRVRGIQVLYRWEGWRSCALSYIIFVDKLGFFANHTWKVYVRCLKSYTL